MKTKITLICLLAFLFFIPKISAQCTSGTQYPVDTYQATNNAGAGIINTDARLGQYAKVHIIPDKRYHFYTSVATDFITITNSTGTQIYASGVSEVYYISIFDEVVRYYIHQNAQCQTNDLFSRTRYLSWVVVPPCLDPTPTGVSNITPNSCKISLIEPSVAPTFGYEAYLGTSTVTPLVDVPTSDSTTNSIFVTNLNPDTTYYYWLRSDCLYQKGDWIFGGSFTTISSLLCNSAYYGLYPDATFTPTCTGNNEIFSNDSKNGSYSNIAVTANTQYTFRTDWELDFITITNALGTVVLSSGTGPVIWNSGGTSGLVRFYSHADAQCNLGGVSLGIRSKYVKCVTTSATCLPPTNLAVANITSNSCRLAWTAPTIAPNSGYEIYLVTNNVAPGITTTATLTSTTAGVDVINGLTAGVTYYYWIRSNCGSDKSTWASGGNFTVNNSLSCNGAIYGLYPNATFTPACTGTAEQIATDCWAGEYSNVNVSTNRQYTFTSSVASDYISITNTAGTSVLASGLTPLSWASGATSGVVRFHLNSNVNCGSQNTNRTRSIQCAVATGCGLPTSLSVSNITSNSSRLNWTAPTIVPASYDIYIITTNTAPTAATVATATSTTAGVGVLNGLGAATTYFYWIRSNCGTTKSAWVSGGNFTTNSALICNGAINGLYPDATYTPTCSGSFEQIVADAWAGEYANVNVLVNKQYTFKSAIATDFITITNATGTTVLASGLTPLIWSSNSTSGVIRYHFNTNANCGTQNTSRVRSVKCTNALGIDEYNVDNLLKIYPNPNAGQFTVDTGEIIADKITIIDNLGRIISNHKPNAAKTMLNIDGFSDAIYYVKIIYQDKNVTKKLVLKKN